MRSLAGSCTQLLSALLTASSSYEHLTDMLTPFSNALGTCVQHLPEVSCCSCLPGWHLTHCSWGAGNTPAPHLPLDPAPPSLFRIMVDEVVTAIKRLKNNESPGVCSILSEVLKWGGASVHSELYRVILGANKNVVPTDLTWMPRIDCSGETRLALHAPSSLFRERKWW